MSPITAFAVGLFPAFSACCSASSSRSALKFHHRHTHQQTWIRRSEFERQQHFADRGSLVTPIHIKDLSTFWRFLSILAGRHGQMLNKTDLSTPLGVSVPTITEWLNVLELTGQIILARLYFENFGKRLVKSSKVYWGDSGLSCHLLGIQTQPELERSPFLGPLFEGFIASEILKSQINMGRRKELYYLRDRPGLEVDFLLPRANRELWLIECKAIRTVRPQMAAPILSLRRAMRQPLGRMVVVHRKARTETSTSALAPGVEALDVEQFVEALQPATQTRKKRG